MSSRSKLTTAEIAAATGRGRSTVAKALAKLEKSSKVKRHTGRRDGARRDPDRWVARKGKAHQSAGPGTERLRPGQLDGLVLKYLRERPGDGSLGPSAVAKGLSRSSGAVANCLARLAASGQVRETSKSPRRYSPLAKSDPARARRR
ncbi:MAG: hypothetical protein ACLP1Q_07305 [Solirubrobacteraceae bacterium]